MTSWTPEKRAKSIESLQSLGFKPHSAPGGNHDHSFTGQWERDGFVVEQDTLGRWWGNGTYYDSLHELLRCNASRLPEYRRLGIHLQSVDDGVRALGGEQPSHSNWCEDADSAVSELLTTLQENCEYRLAEAQADLDAVRYLVRVFRAP